MHLHTKLLFAYPLTKLLFASLLTSSALCACHVTLDRGEANLPLTFKVEIQEDPGTAEAPLPYSAAARTFTLDIEAIEFSGKPAPWFEGEVFLDVAPRGRLANGQAKTVTLKDGVATVTVEIQRVHGESSIWVEDRGTDDKPGSYATGLSPTIYTSYPTLHDVSETTNIAGSALAGDFVQINTKGRRLVATGLAVDGFYITDLDDPTQSYNAIFAHTHSRPKGVEQGDIITDLIGTVVEFYGFTELGFPTYKVGGHIDEIPILELTTALVADDQEMEKLESRLVEVRDVTVCPLGESYSSFGQWVVLLNPQGNCDGGDGGITVVSALSATKFTPEPLVGKVLPRIVGDLRYHVSARPSWIMYTRSDADIEIE